MKYEWKNVYCVNNKEIDQQHKKLFELLDELENSSINNNEENSSKIINMLLQDTKDHFSYEENLMKEVNYTGLEDHIKEHIFFINEIKKLQAQVNTGANIFISIEIVNVLRNLIITHMLGTDQEYVEYLKD